MVPVSLRKISFAGLLVMSCMLILQILWFQQRAFFLDLPHMAYLIINKGSVAIQERRWGSFITHLFPLAALKAGLGLKGILVWYNASFFIFFTTVYAILHYRFRQYDLCILLLAYFTLFVGDVFLWSNNEVHQGICWALLGIGIYNHHRERNSLAVGNIFIAAVLLFLGLCTHLLVGIPVLFYWMFRHLVAEQQYPIKWYRNAGYWGGSLLILVAVALRYYMSSRGGYDSGKLEQVQALSPASVIAALRSPHAIGFYGMAGYRYAGALAVLLIGVYLLVRQRAFLGIMLMAGAIAGYWVLINLTYPDAVGRHMFFYMESEYMVMAVVLMLPLTVYLLPRLSFGRQGAIIAVFLLLPAGIRIVDGYRFFDNRLFNLKQLSAVAEQHNIAKSYMLVDAAWSSKYFMMDWAIPLETLFYTGIYGEKPVTVKLSNEVPDTVNSQLIFYSSYARQEVADIRNDLMKADTVSGYRQLPFDSLAAKVRYLGD